MQYLNKVTGSAINLAKQSVQIISTVASSNNAFSTSSSHGPAEEIQYIYKEICGTIESIVNSSDSSSQDFDVKLNQSGIRDLLRKFTVLLKVESETWLAKEKSIYTTNDFKDMNDTPIPTIEACLAANMIPGLCKLALEIDRKGVLPMMMSAVSNLLRTIQYPLLPHQSIHKATRQLISFALEYKTRQGMKMPAVLSQTKRNEVFQDVSNHNETIQSYQRRIDISLASLLRTIWMKIYENPSLLNSFILMESRKSIHRDLLSSSSIDSAEESPTHHNNPHYRQQQQQRDYHNLSLHIDIIQGLIPLLYEVKLSPYIQETFSRIFSLKDPRILKYLVENTSFSRDLVMKLCDYYQSLLQLSIHSTENEFGDKAIGWFGDRQGLPGYFEYIQYGTTTTRDNGASVPLSTTNSATKPTTQSNKKPPLSSAANNATSAGHNQNNNNNNTKQTLLSNYIQMIQFLGMIVQHLNQYAQSPSSQNVALQSLSCATMSQDELDTHSSKAVPIIPAPINISNAQNRSSATDKEEQQTRKSQGKASSSSSSKKKRAKEEEESISYGQFAYFFQKQLMNYFEEEFVFNTVMFSLQQPQETVGCIVYELLRMFFHHAHHSEALDRYHHQQTTADNDAKHLGEVMGKLLFLSNSDGDNDDNDDDAFMLLSRDSTDDNQKDDNDAVMGRNKSTKATPTTKVIIVSSYWITLIDRMNSLNKLVATQSMQLISTLYHTLPSSLIQTLLICHNTSKPLSSTSSSSSSSSSQEIIARILKAGKTNAASLNPKGNNINAKILNVLIPYQPLFRSSTLSLVSFPLLNPATTASTSSSSDLIMNYFHQNALSRLLSAYYSSLSSSSACTNAALATNTNALSITLVYYQRMTTKLITILKASYYEQLLFSNCLHEFFIQVILLSTFTPSSSSSSTSFSVLLLSYLEDILTIILQLLEEIEKKYFQMMENVQKKCLYWKQYLYDEAFYSLLQHSPALVKYIVQQQQRQQLPSIAASRLDGNESSHGGYGGFAYSDGMMDDNYSTHSTYGGGASSYSNNNSMHNMNSSVHNSNNNNTSNNNNIMNDNSSHHNNSTVTPNKPSVTPNHTTTNTNNNNNIGNTMSSTPSSGRSFFSSFLTPMKSSTTTATNNNNNNNTNATPAPTATTAITEPSSSSSSLLTAELFLDQYTKQLQLNKKRLDQEFSSSGTTAATTGAANTTPRRGSFLASTSSSAAQQQQQQQLQNQKSLCISYLFLQELYYELLAYVQLLPSLAPIVVQLQQQQQPRQEEEQEEEEQERKEGNEEWYDDYESYYQLKEWQQKLLQHRYHHRNSNSEAEESKSNNNTNTPFLQEYEVYVNSIRPYQQAMMLSSANTGSNSSSPQPQGNNNNNVLHSWDLEKVEQEFLNQFDTMSQTLQQILSTTTGTTGLSNAEVVVDISDVIQIESPLASLSSESI